MKRRLEKKKRKQRQKGYSTRAQRKKNKALCKRYPFLIPRQVWTDKIVWLNKPYDWTLVDEFPYGWWKAFGLQLCEELRNELIKYNYLNKYRLVQIKEKFGQLRIYDDDAPVGCDVYNIIEDYSVLSENICERCGKPDTSMINWGGWYQAICEECYNKVQKRQQKEFGFKPIPYSHWKPSDPNMPNERKYASRYRKPLALDIGEWDVYVQIFPEFQKQDSLRIKSDGTLTMYVMEKHTRNLKEKAEGIRSRWESQHKR